MKPSKNCIAQPCYKSVQGLDAKEKHAKAQRKTGKNLPRATLLQLRAGLRIAETLTTLTTLRKAILNYVSICQVGGMAEYTNELSERVCHCEAAHFRRPRFGDLPKSNPQSASGRLLRNLGKAPRRGKRSQ